MTELGEFAQHSSDLERLSVRLIAISVDDQQHAHSVWENPGERKFTILGDPGAKIITKYGLLHKAGYRGTDIALRTTLLIGPDGRERWRRVSESVPDIATWDETFAMIQKVKEQQ